MLTVALVFVAYHAPSTQCIAPGLVLVRGALSTHEQRALLLHAREQNGFAAGGDGRTRLYERVDALPDCFGQLCAQAVAAARDVDAALPSCEATHCLVNAYDSPSGLRWHRDIYQNDGDGDHPIVNLSVGASCRFGVRLGGTELEVRLRSGDAILFGGPSRFVEHAVLEVLLDEMPTWMAEEGHGDPMRLSFTFREAPSVLGHEDKYKTFDVGQDFFEATQCAWRPSDGLIAV